MAVTPQQRIEFILRKDQNMQITEAGMPALPRAADILTVLQKWPNISLGDVIFPVQFLSPIYTERYLLTSRIRTVSSLVADNQAGRQSKVGL